MTEDDRAGLRRVTFAMNASVDGYVVDRDGAIDWGAPDEEVFRAHLEDLRGTDVHFLGRRLYETMLYWESAEVEPTLGEDELEWARRWRQLPKVVFSHELSAVQGSAQLAEGDLAAEVERWRAGPGTGVLAIGGADLAGQAAEVGLVDEYRVWVHPVLLGGGRPMFPQAGRRVALELVDSRAFGSGVVCSRYRVVR